MTHTSLILFVSLTYSTGLAFYKVILEYFAKHAMIYTNTAHYKNLLVYNKKRD